MKKLVNKLLFGQTFFKEFPAVAIDEYIINESVIFEVDGLQSEVSQTHWLLSLEPMVFGIWVDKKIKINDKTSDCKLFLNSKQNKTVAISNLIFTERIIEDKGELLLFKVKNTKLFYFSFIKTYLIYILYYKNPSQSFNQFKNLTAAFSYPRKVRLVSFKKDDYFNIFPMDLIGEVPETNLFFFGLRHSNSTLKKIVVERKIVATELPFSLKDSVYELSHHHSSKSPSFDSLPFQILKTKLYDFPIPESAIKYHEIEVVKHLNLGSHMLFWGKAENVIEVNENNKNLYHIHFLNYLYQKKSQFQYELI